ncbi:uncharacterized protein LOC125873856 [Solanum stenotomum]|uniref:uncharacterized protein LOC125873856 n=1 Tax=Solanum stenotomum TaxID=172797 RepID=UPI0020D11C76|nr:uncharacterized protein LOC125873856 [Solanum stenotomum]
MVRDFVRMNPPKFLGSQVGEDQNNFIDEVKKIFGVMEVTSNDRVELASYQLKDVAHILFTKWKDNRGADASPVTWDCFTRAFLDRFFPRELREAKAQELMNSRQGTVPVQVYRLKFTHLSTYAPHMVANPRAQTCKFLLKVCDLVKTKCRNDMLLGDMDISKLMTHAQQVEGDKLKKMAKGNKKARIGNYKEGFFGCGQYGHRLKDCPSSRLGKGGNNNGAQSTALAAPTGHPTQQGASSGTGGSQHQNRLNALQARQENKDSPDVATIDPTALASDATTSAPSAEQERVSPSVPPTPTTTTTTDAGIDAQANAKLLLHVILLPDIDAPDDSTPPETHPID